MSENVPADHRETRRYTTLSVLIYVLALVIGVMLRPLLWLRCLEARWPDAASAIWHTHLFLFALSVVGLLISTFRYVWLFQRRCSPLAPLTLLLLCGILGFLGYVYLDSTLRPP